MLDHAISYAHVNTHTHTPHTIRHAHTHDAARTCDSPDFAPWHCACPRLELLLAASAPVQIQKVRGWVRCLACRKSWTFVAD